MHIWLLLLCGQYHDLLMNIELSLMSVAVLFNVLRCVRECIDEAQRWTLDGRLVIQSSTFTCVLKTVVYYFVKF